MRPEWQGSGDKERERFKHLLEKYYAARMLAMKKIIISHTFAGYVRWVDEARESEICRYT